MCFEAMNPGANLANISLSGNRIVCQVEGAPAAKIVWYEATLVGLT